MWNEFWGMLTLLIGTAGVCSYIYCMNPELKHRTKMNTMFLYFSVAMFFAVTMLFGVMNIVKIDLDHVLYPLRCLIMVFCIMAVLKSNKN